MSKHTQGHWVVCNGSDIFTPLGAGNAEGIEAPIDDGCMIADCDMGSFSFDEVTANARLIAAAPELLEALLRLRAAFVVLAGEKSLFAKAALELPDAAILKARGDK